MSDLWSDKNQLPENMTEAEYNLHEDILCLKEDNQQLKQQVEQFEDALQGEMEMKVKAREQRDKVTKQFMGLKASCERMRDDLLLRADIDPDGTRAVNVSSSVWNNFCEVLDANS